MKDFDLLVRNMLSGIVFSLPIYGVGWFLSKSGQIDEKFVRWIFYPLGSGILGFFILGIVLDNIGLPMRLVFTLAVWMLGMAMSLFVSRI